MSFTQIDLVSGSPFYESNSKLSFFIIFAEKNVSLAKMPFYSSLVSIFDRLCA